MKYDFKIKLIQITFYSNDFWFKLIFNPLIKFKDEMMTKQ